MIYRVGQRVKKIRHRSPSESGYIGGGWNALIGSEATVVGYATDGDIRIVYDPIVCCPAHESEVTPGMIAPLTDPGCERFIASLDKLIREPGTIKDPAPEWDVA